MKAAEEDEAVFRFKSGSNMQSKSRWLRRKPNGGLDSCSSRLVGLSVFLAALSLRRRHRRPDSPIWAANWVNSLSSMATVSA